MKIIVASLNPVKINAALNAFKLAFPKIEFEVSGINVISGVREQPMSDKEAQTGSFNRANNAKAADSTADYWVGLEGGVDMLDGKMLSLGWVTVMNKIKVGQCRTTSYALPDKLRDLILSGMELGAADDIVFNKKNSKQQNGAVGILTHDIITRTQGFTNATVLALVPFMNPDLY